MKCHLLILLFTAAFTFCSCSSNPATKVNPVPKYKVNVRVENHPLSPAQEWIGGTEKFPKYYTAQGQEIITPIFGVDVVPVTKRSVDKRGRVIYPHHGFRVIGDVRLEHYLVLMKDIQKLNIDRQSKNAPTLIMDSNFPEKGALLKSPEGEVIAKYKLTEIK